MTTTDTDPYSRDNAIRTIRAALKRRSGKVWSVTGDRGTAWGWITITAPPARRVDHRGQPSKDGYMTEEDTAELGELLGQTMSRSGVVIPASTDYRREYLDRADGRTPVALGSPYWD